MTWHYNDVMIILLQFDNYELRTHHPKWFNVIWYFNIKGIVEVKGGEGEGVNSTEGVTRMKWHGGILLSYSLSLSVLGPILYFRIF